MTTTSTLHGAEDSPELKRFYRTSHVTPTSRK
jgi:hypothetical protein